MRSILIVDDFQPLLELLKEIVLSVFGPEVELLQARTAEEALSKVKEDPAKVSIVITDNDHDILIESAGIELLKFFRDKSPATKRILISGKAERLDTSVADVFLQKPFSVVALATVLRGFSG